MPVPTKSQLSLLSAQTASSFAKASEEETWSPFVQIQMCIDDSSRCGILIESGVTRFALDDCISFVVREQNRNGSRYLLLWSDSDVAAEWKIVTQLRFKVGKDDFDALNLIDMDVFEFTPHSRAISVRITDDVVRAVRFEMRVINKVFTPLPTFEDGNLKIRFENDSSISVHRDLLRSYSDYFDAYLNENTTEILIPNIDKNDFLEMLYQIYPTHRPLSANFASLCRMANRFLSKPLLYSLSRFLVDYNKQPMNFAQKLHYAIEHKLQAAVREITFQAVQNGDWQAAVAAGYNAEENCGASVYEKLVLPAIEEAKSRPLGSTLLTKPVERPNFFDEKNRLDTSTVTLVLLGTPFFVNRGIVSIHGTSKFRRDQAGYFHVTATQHFVNLCAAQKLYPGQVFTSLLNSLYPLGAPVDSVSLRAAIVFCHDNGWQIAKDNLEQGLLTEPAMSVAQYFDQLKFAEDFGLENALTVTIQKAESSCQEYATDLLRWPQLALSESTRNRLTDMICSGWGLTPKHINKIVTRVPTSFVERVVGLSSGGVEGYEQLDDIATLAGCESDEFFGEPIEMEYVNA